VTVEDACSWKQMTQKMSHIRLVTQGVEINSLDQVIQCLQHHQDTVEHWKSNPPAPQDLAIATINIAALVTFLKKFQHEEIDSLKAQLDYANKQIKEMETKISSLEQSITELKGENVLLKRDQAILMRNHQLFMLNDLNVIYRTSIAESKIGSWGTFAQSVWEMKDKLDMNEITLEQFTNFITPYNTLLGFDVSTFMDFIQDRHEIGHTDIRRASNQQSFIQTCRTTSFNADMQPFVDEIIRQLDSASISYRRIK
jgi:uncharacterized protein YqgV (UPF0045/DUF77 family)/cell division protein FtsB